MSGHKRVWAQTCVGTNMSGHKHVWAQSCLATNVSGHNRVWAQMCGLNRAGSSMYGHKRVVSINCIENCPKIDTSSFGSFSGMESTALKKKKDFECRVTVWKITHNNSF